MVEEVILVDEQDNAIGQMEKIQAHEQALLHRAFSIFLFNSEGKLLLQQRAKEKYHSPELWTNTCCSHPRPGETVVEAGHRRLKEEMGMTAELEQQFSFIYKTPFDNGLTEHELDHVLFGNSDELPDINPDEVMRYTYKSLEQIAQEIERHPEHYTSWFKICLPEVMKFKAGER